MKFDHRFKLNTFDGTYAVYKSENNIARLDFISENAVRVAVYKEGCKMLPSFSVCPDNVLSRNGRERLSLSGFNTVSPKKENNDYYLPCGVKISVNENNFLLSFFKNDKKLFSDRVPLSYNLENEFGSGVFHYVSREENEIILGLGDKGGNLNKSGRAFRIETSDSMGYNAKISDPLYKHIPFYICENSKGAYGIFYDTSCTSYVDLGKEINNYYEPYKYFKSEDNCLVYYVFFGSKVEILKSFATLCGKQAFPPKWSFDYCASTMAYTDEANSDELMYGFLEKIKETKLSCSGFYLSSGYTSIGNNRYVFNWNTDKFKDPEEFIERFNKAGINIIPNIKPAFLTDHPYYEKLKGEGLFVKGDNGEPFVTQFWDGLGSYLDFTNEKAFQFWKEQVKEKLLSLKIRATWNDNNEFDIKDNTVELSSLRPALTYLMVLASFEAQRETYPDERPFLSTRSGGVGIRRLAQTWSGDNRTEFKDLRYCHNIGLTMSLSGLYFYGHDLGGFTGDMPNRELFLRWLQHGVFEPRFTIHSWNKDGSATMPWSYDDLMPYVKDIFKVRRKLLPYLYTCAYNAVENEVPLNAPLCLYYKDADTEKNDAFMLGKNILAVCVFDEGKEDVSVTLPKEHNWYLGDTLYKGGENVNVNIPAKGTPKFFVKSGSVIPFDEGECEYESKEDIVFTVYPKETGSFSSFFFNDDGKSFNYKSGDAVMLDINVTCNEDSVTVKYKNEGKTEFVPRFRLVSGDKRKLTVL